jgi:lambda repressor-like predicted transcriptional regulator
MFQELIDDYRRQAERYIADALEIEPEAVSNTRTSWPQHASEGLRQCCWD